MSKIYPFRARRYNPHKIADFSKVVAPPYDVISPRDLDKLHFQSPFNITWIDLPQDSASASRYEVAREIYDLWKKESVLVQDDEASIYLYFQTFTIENGQTLTRKGFFATRQLEKFGEGDVKPHEKTFAGPKEDRFQLMKATEAQLSPIFGLYNDPESLIEPLLEKLAQREPDIQIMGANGEEHRLWKISDPAKIEELLSKIHDSTLMIADGHHRYETALNYRELRKAQATSPLTGNENFNRVMMYFCSLQDSGLIVLPTHRVLAEKVKMPIDQIRGLLDRYATRQIFPIEKKEAALKLLENSKNNHVLAWIHDREIEILTFDANKLLESASLNHMHFALRDLDVTILHDLILEEILGISKGQQREYGTIQYIKSSEEAMRLAKENQCFAFLMNATKIPQIEAITEIGETMPQKSTFFYPKLLTGLLFYDLE